MAIGPALASFRHVAGQAVEAVRPQTQDLAKTAINENPFPKDKLTSLYRTAAADILARTDKKQGFCQVLGSENGRLAHELAK